MSFETDTSGSPDQVQRLTERAEWLRKHDPAQAVAMRRQFLMQQGFTEWETTLILVLEENMSLHNADGAYCSVMAWVKKDHEESVRDSVTEPADHTYTSTSFDDDGTSHSETLTGPRPASFIMLTDDPQRPLRWSTIEEEANHA